MDLVLGFQYKAGLEMMGKTERTEEWSGVQQYVSQCHGYRKTW